MFFSSKLVRVAALFAACFAVAGLTSAQVKPSGKGYLLRSTYKKGEVRRYSMSTIIDMGVPQKQRMDSPFTMKVLSVKGDVANLQMTMGPVLMGGKQMGQTQTANVSVNSLGQPVGKSSAPQQMGQISFPKKPVRIGEVWKTRVKSDMMNMPMTVNGEFKLTGFKGTGSKRAAIIAVKISSDGPVKTAGTGTMLLAPADGSLMRSTMAMTMTITPQQKDAKPMRYRANVTIARK